MKSTTLESARVVTVNTVVIPFALGVGAITLLVGVYKWWRKKI